METKEWNQLWNQLDQNKIEMNDARLLIELTDEGNKMDRKIKQRDGMESLVAVVLIPVAIALAFILPTIASKIVILMIIPYALLVIYKLRKAKKQGPDKVYLSLKENLTEDLSFYKRQRDLLNSVLGWYISPAMIVTLGLFVSLNMPMQKLLVFAPVTIGLGAFIYWLNKRALKQQIAPLIKKMEGLLSSLREDVNV